MPIQKFPNTQQIETDPLAVKLADVENAISTSTTKVPNSAILKVTKEALESSIASKSPQSTTYTKDEVDTIASGKAPVSHTHAQSEITNLETDLADKAPQSNTYTKTEVDSAIAGAGGGNGTAFTSGGTIAIGDLIETYNDSGTYKSRKVTAEVSGTPQTLLTPFTPNSNFVTVWHPTASRFITIQGNSFVSNYLQTIVSSVSGTTITSQTPVSQVSLAVSRIYAFYDSDQDAVICAFEQTGGTAGIYVCQFTISGNTATISTPQLVVSSYTYFSSFIKIGTNKYVATYGASSVGHKIVAMTVSAGVFTFGSVYTTPTAEAVGYVTPVWDSSQSKLFFFFIKASSTPYTYCYVVLTISGTTWTQAQGETTILVSGNYASHWQGVYYNGYIYVFVQGFDFAQTYYGFMKYSIATNTLTFQKFIPMSKSTYTLAGHSLILNGTDLYVVANYQRQIIKCTLTNSDLLIDSKIYQKQYISGTYNTFVIAGSVFGFFYNDGNRYFRGVIYTALPTISKTIGIAIESATTGQSKKVALNGQIATGLSGLVTGTQYYIQSDGTISQSWTPNRIGRAISDTQLSVNIFEEFSYV